MTKPESEEKKSNESELKIEASLCEKSVQVSSPEGMEGLSSRGYGVKEDERLILAFYEALFLLDRGAIEVLDEKRAKVDFKELLRRFRSVEEDAWFKYLIYRDLRSRGYVARKGFGQGIDFRVYERGDYGRNTAKYLIFVIQEGKSASVEEVARALDYVQSLKKKLVLAVINRRGEVVYYSLSQLNLS